MTFRKKILPYKRTKLMAKSLVSLRFATKTDFASSLIRFSRLFMPRLSLPFPLDSLVINIADLFNLHIMT